VVERRYRARLHQLEAEVLPVRARRVDLPRQRQHVGAWGTDERERQAVRDHLERRIDHRWRGQPERPGRRPPECLQVLVDRQQRDVADHELPAGHDLERRRPRRPGCWKAPVLRLLVRHHHPPVRQPPKRRVQR
jgi:hypothetical protein